MIAKYKFFDRLEFIPNSSPVASEIHKPRTQGSRLCPREPSEQSGSVEE